MASNLKSDIKKAFGHRVRKLRTEAGFSQEGFAHECGLHRTYMGKVERGEKNISIENIGKIATALNLKISELFGSI